MTFIGREDTPFSEYCNTERGIHHLMHPECNSQMANTPDIRRARLRQFRDERCDGVDAELARRIGRSPSQVADMLVGRKSFGERIARDIEAELQLPDKWLDQAPPADFDAPQAISEDRGKYDLDFKLDAGVGESRLDEATGVKGYPIPVISSVQAGRWEEAFDPYAPGAALRWEHDTELPPKDAFLLEVDGDSMEDPAGEDSFPHGSLILIDPHRRPKFGDYVVVRNNDWDTATFKQYGIDMGQKVLKPLNPRWPVRPIPPGTVMVGVVTKKIIVKRY